ncbi:MAG: hypothetical protein JWQ40_2075 [Segetibacter sp.]|nr:hypothetical protein [Segetibacter sp.]
MKEFIVVLVIQAGRLIITVTSRRLATAKQGDYKVEIIKKDIESREDIFLLVKKFYEKLLTDDTISYIFTDVAKIDLDHHLPILVDFWDMVLFGADTYRKNAIQPHMVLHQKSSFEKHHFETWLGYFNTTVDELFDGPVAFSAKQKAKSIATIMQIKIAQMK